MTELADIRFPWYQNALDLERITRDYPPPPDFFRGVFRASRDELRALQERRFLQTMKRGWEIPFFQRHWGSAGMQPGDIRGLDDLPKIPSVVKNFHFFAQPKFRIAASRPGSGNTRPMVGVRTTPTNSVSGSGPVRNSLK